VRVLREARQLDEIAIVGPAPAYQSAWHALGVHHVITPGEDLNADLELGRHWALEHGAETLLVVHGDLGWLDPASVRQLVRRAAGSQVVIAGNLTRTGTNALALRPPDALPFAFGEGSFEGYRRLASDRGLTYEELSTPGLAYDIDLPSDLADYEAHGGWERHHATYGVKDSA
jgi:2-phospho-L-lactate/phosphoenolpyruvate guanylyltransferase